MDSHPEWCGLRGLAEGFVKGLHEPPKDCPERKGEQEAVGDATSRGEVIGHSGATHRDRPRG